MEHREIPTYPQLARALGTTLDKLLRYVKVQGFTSLDEFLGFMRDTERKLRAGPQEMVRLIAENAPERQQAVLEWLAYRVVDNEESQLQLDAAGIFHALARQRVALPALIHVTPKLIRDLTNRNSNTFWLISGILEEFAQQQIAIDQLTVSVAAIATAQRRDRFAGALLEILALLIDADKQTAFRRVFYRLWRQLRDDDAEEREAALRELVRTARNMRLIPTDQEHLRREILGFLREHQSQAFSADELHAEFGRSIDFRRYLLPALEALTEPAATAPVVKVVRERKDQRTRWQEPVRYQLRSQHRARNASGLNQLLPLIAGVTTVMWAATAHSWDGAESTVRGDFGEVAWSLLLMMYLFAAGRLGRSLVLRKSDSLVQRFLDETSERLSHSRVRADAIVEGVESYDHLARWTARIGQLATALASLGTVKMLTQVPAWLPDQFGLPLLTAGLVVFGNVYLLTVSRAPHSDQYVTELDLNGRTTELEPISPEQVLERIRGIDVPRYESLEQAQVAQEGWRKAQAELERIETTVTRVALLNRQPLLDAIAQTRRAIQIEWTKAIVAALEFMANDIEQATDVNDLYILGLQVDALKHRIDGFTLLPDSDKSEAFRISRLRVEEIAQKIRALPSGHRDLHADGLLVALTTTAALLGFASVADALDPGRFFFTGSGGWSPAWLAVALFPIAWAILTVGSQEDGGAPAPRPTLMVQGLVKSDAEREMHNRFGLAARKSIREVHLEEYQADRLSGWLDTTFGERVNFTAMVAPETGPGGKWRIIRLRAERIRTVPVPSQEASTARARVVRTLSDEVFRVLVGWLVIQGFDEVEFTALAERGQRFIRRRADSWAQTNGPSPLREEVTATGERRWVLDLARLDPEKLISRELKSAHRLIQRALRQSAGGAVELHPEVTDRSLRAILPVLRDALIPELGDSLRRPFDWVWLALHETSAAREPFQRVVNELSRFLVPGAQRAQHEQGFSRAVGSFLNTLSLSISADQALGWFTPHEPAMRDRPDGKLTDLSAPLSVGEPSTAELPVEQRATLLLMIWPRWLNEQRDQFVERLSGRIPYDLEDELAQRAGEGESTAAEIYQQLQDYPRSQRPGGGPVNDQLGGPGHGTVTGIIAMLTPSLVTGLLGAGMLLGSAAAVSAWDGDFWPFGAGSTLWNTLWNVLGIAASVGVIGAGVVVSTFVVSLWLNHQRYRLIGSAEGRIRDRFGSQSVQRLNEEMRRDTDNLVLAAVSGAELFTASALAFLLGFFGMGTAFFLMWAGMGGLLWAYGRMQEKLQAIEARWHRGPPPEQNLQSTDGRRLGHRTQDTGHAPQGHAELQATGSGSSARPQGIAEQEREPEAVAEIDRLPMDVERIALKLQQMNRAALSARRLALSDYHEKPVQYARMVSLLKQYAGPLAGKRVREIGPKDGAFLLALRELGLEAEGLEISQNAAQSARERWGLSVIQGDFLEPPADTVAFPSDVTFSIGVLDFLVSNGEVRHPINREIGLRALAQLARLTKQEGVSIHGVAIAGDFPFTEDDLSQYHFELIGGGFTQEFIVLRRLPGDMLPSSIETTESRSPSTGNEFLMEARVDPRSPIEGAGPVNVLIQEEYLDQVGNHSVEITERLRQEILRQVPEDQLQHLRADQQVWTTIEIMVNGTDYLVMFDWDIVHRDFSVRRIRSRLGTDIFVSGVWQRTEFATDHAESWIARIQEIAVPEPPQISGRATVARKHIFENRRNLLRQRLQGLRVLAGEFQRANESLVAHERDQIQATFWRKEQELQAAVRVARHGILLSEISLPHGERMPISASGVLNQLQAINAATRLLGRYERESAQVQQSVESFGRSEALLAALRQVQTLAEEHRRQLQALLDPQRLRARLIGMVRTLKVHPNTAQSFSQSVVLASDLLSIDTALSDIERFAAARAGTVADHDVRSAISGKRSELRTTAELLSRRAVVLIDELPSSRLAHPVFSAALSSAHPANLAAALQNAAATDGRMLETLDREVGVLRTWLDSRRSSRASQFMLQLLRTHLPLIEAAAARKRQAVTRAYLDAIPTMQAAIDAIHVPKIHLGDTEHSVSERPLGEREIPQTAGELEALTTFIRRTLAETPLDPTLRGQLMASYGERLRALARIATAMEPLVRADQELEALAQAVNRALVQVQLEPAASEKLIVSYGQKWHELLVAYEEIVSQVDELRRTIELSELVPGLAMLDQTRAEDRQRIVTALDNEPAARLWSLEFKGQRSVARAVEGVIARLRRQLSPDWPLLGPVQPQPHDPLADVRSARAQVRGQLGQLDAALTAIVRELEAMYAETVAAAIDVHPVVEEGELTLSEFDLGEPYDRANAQLTTDAAKETLHRAYRAKLQRIEEERRKTNVVAVRLSPTVQQLTGGRAELQAGGLSIREVLEDLDRQFPGIMTALVDVEHDRPREGVVFRIVRDDEPGGIEARLLNAMVGSAVLQIEQYPVSAPTQPEQDANTREADWSDDSTEGSSQIGNKAHLVLVFDEGDRTFAEVAANSPSKRKEMLELLPVEEPNVLKRLAQLPAIVVDSGNNKQLLQALLARLQRSPPTVTLKTFAESFADFGGFSSISHGFIAVYHILVSSPIAIFHELGHFLIDSGRLQLEPQALESEQPFILVILDGEELGRVQLTTAETRGFARRDTPHDLLRAIQREWFDLADIRLSTSIGRLKYLSAQGDIQFIQNSESEMLDGLERLSEAYGRMKSIGSLSSTRNRLELLWEELARMHREAEKRLEQADELRVELSAFEERYTGLLDLSNQEKQANDSKLENLRRFIEQFRDTIWRNQVAVRRLLDEGRGGLGESFRIFAPFAIGLSALLSAMAGLLFFAPSQAIAAEAVQTFFGTHNHLFSSIEDSILAVLPRGLLTAAMLAPILLSLRHDGGRPISLRGQRLRAWFEHHRHLRPIQVRTLKDLARIRASDEGAILIPDGERWLAPWMAEMVTNLHRPASWEMAEPAARAVAAVIARRADIHRAPWYELAVMTEKMTFAVQELITNASGWGNQRQPGRAVIVSWRVTDDRVELHVIDEAAAQADDDGHTPGLTPGSQGSHKDIARGAGISIEVLRERLGFDIGASPILSEDGVRLGTDVRATYTWNAKEESPAALSDEPESIRRVDTEKSLADVPEAVVNQVIDSMIRRGEAIAVNLRGDVNGYFDAALLQTIDGRMELARRLSETS